MNLENRIRTEIHRKKGLKKLLHKIVFKFFCMYIQCIDKYVEETISEIKHDSATEKLKVRQNQLRLDFIEQSVIPRMDNEKTQIQQKLENYYELNTVMITDGIDLKIQEALEK